MRVGGQHPFSALGRLGLKSWVLFWASLARGSMPCHAVGMYELGQLATVRIGC